MLPYSDSGTGPILLFLHFFGSSHREWRHVINRLHATHRCIAADMPGFGDAAHVTGYSVQEMVTHIRTLVESFAPAPVTLVAHSFSGKVAMVLSATPPANLQRNILVAPSPLLPEPMTEEARAQMRVRNQSREGAEAFIEGSHSRPLSEDDTELAIDDVLRANTSAWLAWPDSGSLEDWSARTTLLRVPSELIVGEHDQAVPLAFQQEHTLPLVQKTGGDLHVIRGAAHMLPNEAPDELAALVAKLC